MGEPIVAPVVRVVKQTLFVTAIVGATFIVRERTALAGGDVPRVSYDQLGTLVKTEIVEQSVNWVETCKTPSIKNTWVIEDAVAVTAIVLAVTGIWIVITVDLGRKRD